MTNIDLKIARMRLGLTQKAMAEAMNTPYRTYQDWEAGRRRVPGIVDVAVSYIESGMKRPVEAKSWRRSLKKHDGPTVLSQDSPKKADKKQCKSLPSQG